MISTDAGYAIDKVVVTHSERVAKN